VKYNEFLRNEEVRNTPWQFVGHLHEGNERLVWVQVGYKDHEDKWHHFPLTELEAREGQTREDRFNEFVDRLIRPAEETV
jgi:hypothetical protein